MRHPHAACFGPHPDLGEKGPFRAVGKFPSKTRLLRLGASFKLGALHIGKIYRKANKTMFIGTASKHTTAQRQPALRLVARSKFDATFTTTTSITIKALMVVL